MENLLNKSREEIEKFVFKRDYLEILNELVENKYKKEKKETFKIFFISSFIFLFSTIGMYEILATVINYNNIIIMFILSTVAFFSMLISFVFSLASFVNVIYYLFTKEENHKLEKQMVVSEIKIQKLMKTNLNLKELKKLNSLLVKIKENLSEKEFFDLMKMVEIQTNRKLGNAYHFLYLIDNYTKLVGRIKEKQKNDDDFKKQTLYFLNIKKED